jgi:hypothetical protein
MNLQTRFPPTFTKPDKPTLTELGAVKVMSGLDGFWGAITSFSRHLFGWLASLKKASILRLEHKRGSYEEG